MRNARFLQNLLWLTVFVATAGKVSGQIAITATGSPVTETFDAMLGTSATASLPNTQWRVADNSMGTSWTGATRSATTVLGGSAAAVSSGGIYNYGNGAAATATDRALGFLSSGTAPWPGTTANPLSIFAQYQNATGSAVSQISVSFDYEKYRNGTNVNGWNFNFYYSLDGVNWTNVPAGNQHYPADAGNTAVSPVSVINKSFTITGLTIPHNATFFLRWSYFVASGTTATNAQGLAIDNVSVSINSSGTTLPVLSTSPSALSFPTTQLNNSTTATYSLAAADLTADIVLTASGPFSISSDNSSFGTSLTIAKTDAALPTGKTIYVKFTPTAAGISNGSISHASEGADTKTVTLAGTGVGLINLSSSPYIQNFNTIGSGLPVGVTVRTGATATTLGTNAAFTATPTAWNNTGGSFKNFASGNNDLGVTQNTATDRALGVRQTGAFGDPGAAFVFQLANTTGKINFSLNFNLQSLDVASERVTTWRVDYGFGANPTQFTTAATSDVLTTGGNSFSNTPIHVDFGNALDNKSEVITIRIVALTSTTGANSRASTGIDDFTLSWEDPTAETLSLSTTTLAFPATAIGGSTTVSYSIVGQTNLSAPIVLTTAGPFALSVDNTNFSASISIDPAQAANKTIYVRFSPTATGIFPATITHSSGSVSKVISISGEAVDPAALTFNFNTCSTGSVPGSGFLSINVSGTQRWGCSQFGRNSTTGVDINGFSAGAAQTNDAWLISPALNLNGITNLPVLSFYSRGEFSGPKLQLYVSTTYSGSGVPNLADWTELTTANFPTPPGSATTAWTLSDNIDLSAYKTAARVYIAFRYTSGPGLGAARWSVDDIAITDQSGLLTVSPSQLNFGEVATGNKSVAQTVTLQSVGGSDLSLTPPAGYEISKDNVSFTAGTLLLTRAEANGGLTLYIRFAPTSKQLKVEGNITVTADGLAKNVVAVSGSSYPKSETFDVATYNLSFFGAGSTNSATPQQIATQVANITTVFQRLNMDVIGVEEVSSDAAMAQLVANLPGYASILSPRWSYSFNPPDPTFPPQKIGFVYNTNVMTLSAEEPPRAMFEGLYDSARLGLTGHRLTGYPGGAPSSFWASGRLPYMATFQATVDGVSKKIRMVVIHAKSGGTVADFQRRLYDIQVLKDSLDAFYAADEVILLGDYNDRIVRSIYAGSATSSYLPFVNDPANYTIVTKELDAAGRTSFPSSNGLIDHILISNELLPDYISGSSDIEDPRGYISAYNAVAASDHLPVYSRFAFQPCLVSAPAAISGPAAICAGGTLSYSIEPVATATTYQWIVPQGWTITEGQGRTGIMVTATATGGDISVVAVSGCGSSLPATLAVAADTERPVVTVPPVPVLCYATGDTYTVPPVTATDNCALGTTSYAITGATTRTGNGLDASGTFNTGTSTITWTVKDAAGNETTAETTITVNTAITAAVPDVYAVNSGGNANTRYIGYGAQSLTLQAGATGGTAPYTFKWTAGTEAGTGVEKVAYTVSPQATTTYYLTVTDANGCTAPAVSKTVQVVDVRCGDRLEKIIICEVKKNKTGTKCVHVKHVAAALASGSSLGSCAGPVINTRIAQTMEESTVANAFRLSGSPNPASAHFTLQVSSADGKTPVQLRVTDLLGRTIEIRNNVVPNSNLQLGSGYKAGVYLVEVAQGAERRQLKLIKK